MIPDRSFMPVLVEKNDEHHCGENHRIGSCRNRVLVYDIKRERQQYLCNDRGIRKEKDNDACCSQQKRNDIDMVIIESQKLKSLEDKVPDRKCAFVFDRVKEVADRVVVTRDKPALRFVSPRLVMASCKHSNANVDDEDYTVKYPQFVQFFRGHVNL